MAKCKFVSLNKSFALEPSERTQNATEAQNIVRLPGGRVSRQQSEEKDKEKKVTQLSDQLSAVCLFARLAGHCFRCVRLEAELAACSLPELAARQRSLPCGARSLNRTTTIANRNKNSSSLEVLAQCSTCSDKLANKFCFCCYVTLCAATWKQKFVSSTRET